MIRYLTAIIDENGDFKITSMCRFPREEDYKTFLSYNISSYQVIVTDNLGYRWASDNMSVAWTSNDNFSNYNSYYNNNNGLGSFLGLTSNSGFSNNGLQNLLQFVNGNYNNNSQYALLYNILANAASQYVSSNGNVSAGGLFSVLNQLLRG